MMQNSGTKCWNNLNQPVLHGEYFTPNANDICKKCKCLAGQAIGCFFEKCPQLPGCDHYKQVEGTCCEFECLQDNGLSGKTEFAVLFSLSSGLVVLLIILFLVLYCQRQRIKKSKEESEMTKTQTVTEQSQSTTSGPPEVITPPVETNPQGHAELPPPYSAEPRCRVVNGPRRARTPPNEPPPPYADKEESAV